MNNRRCKHSERESWCYGRYSIEGIVSAISCEICYPWRVGECDYDKCPRYNPVTIDEYYKDVYDVLNNSLKYSFGHYTFKTTSREYTKYFTEI